MTNQSSILLTYWDPDIYVPQVATPFLQELFLYSLLFGEVVIRDVDLFLNPFIGRQLASSESDFRLLVELIQNNCVQILTLPPALYRGVESDPTIEPFSARSERHQKSCSFKGEQWRPEEWQKVLCLKLDAAVNGTRLRSMAPFPSRNDFAPRLAWALDLDPTSKFPWFTDITGEAKHTFKRLCVDDQAWESFLRADNRESIVGEGQGFYRTAAYQCAKKCGESQRALRNLIQSVYAWCECDREGTEGRYGGRLPWEIPYSYLSRAEERDHTDKYMNLQLVPKRYEREFPIAPGIGEVLATTRMSPAFKYFQQTWAGIGRPQVTESTFWNAYHQLIEVFAENAARKFVPSSSHVTWQVIGITLILGGHVLGLSVLPSSVTGEGVALLGPELSKFVRSIAFVEKAKRELRDAVEIRSNRIKETEGPMLNSGPTL